MTSPLLAADHDSHDVSVVILTRGDRPDDLLAAIGSVRKQHALSAEVIVVANGAPAGGAVVSGAGGGLRVVESAENLGIPGGRNLGAAQASAPVVAFLDDDARFTDDAVLARAVDAFRRDAALGAVALHIVDEQGATARRHVPRLGARHPDQSGFVTSFLGGAVLVRQTAFRESGGYAAEFFYSMEETDLALRLIDRGWAIWYDGAPAVFHPSTEPARHEDAARRTFRNRVWLAHRNLPAPLALAYVLNWLVISTLRQPRALAAMLGALSAAWRSRPGPRRPISWRTVLRLTRLGRPPIL